MRNKKQFFSGFLAALMLLSVGLPVLAEELPEAESKPVCTCSARCNADAPDEDCPVCRGTGAMQDEQGWSVSVACMDCGAETAHAEYRTPEERLESARRVALLWNMGKVVHTGASD